MRTEAGAGEARLQAQEHQALLVGATRRCRSPGQFSPRPVRGTGSDGSSASRSGLETGETVGFCHIRKTPSLWHRVMQTEGSI